MLRPTLAPIVCACLAVVVCLAPRVAPAQETKPAGPTTQPLPALANTNVSIPWNELTALIERAKGAAPDRPPVDFVFSPAVYKATVTEKGVSVTADADVTMLTDGYALVPLGPADAGVTAVTVDNAAGPVVLRDKTLYTLLNGKGKKHLTLTAERPTQADAGATRFDLPLIPSPLVTVTTTLPGTSLDVKAPAASSVDVKEAGNATTVTGGYPGGAVASVSWRQRPKEAKAEPRVYADTETLVSVERGLLRSRSKVRLTVERSPVRQVKLAVDPKAVVLTVTGTGVATWAEAAGKDAGGKDVKAVTVEFGAPVEDERTIEVVSELDVPEAGGAAAVGPPGVEGAKRDRGVIAVESRGGFDVRPGESNMERMSVSELPQSVREQAKGALQVAYRYAGQPASASLALEKLKPLPAKVFALTQTRVAVDRGVLRCKAAITYEILHAGVDSLRVRLPAGVEFVAATGEGVRGTQVVEENNQRTLVVGLKDVAKGAYALVVDYDYHFDETKVAGAAATQPATRPTTGPATQPAAATAAVTVPLLAHPDAARDRGYVGLEVRGGYEIVPDVQGAERVDVKELPQALWGLARSPLLFGYRYDHGATPRVALSMTRHQDLDVLVAMSDVCEVSTTYTPDGKSVTKMMFIVRNNLKPFMTLRMPDGAQVWSTFVDDRPVTPSRAADGSVLIPLKKSDDVDDDDDKSYRAKREKRREEGQDEVKHAREMQKAQQARDSDDVARDLKPYDVEIVFVTPAVKLPDRGHVTAALPQSDVPIGQLSWAVFLPKNLRVAYTEGNVTEVSRFTLPFRHFGEAEWQRQEKLAQAAQQLAQAMEKLQDQAKQLAESAKAQGVLPVRVEIPVVGDIHRFEKFLTVDEMPKVDLVYSRKVD